MKVVILAGGMGSRISEESCLKPKPMIEIGGRPILWHIMKWYASFGFQEFIICCGYKGHMVKDYFVNYYIYQDDATYDINKSVEDMRQRHKISWRVTLVDTGLKTLTAGRILKARKYIGNEAFMLTYGDGVSDVDIDRLLDCHKQSGKIATITTTQPAGRFGAIQMKEDGSVCGFKEKARKDQSFVNIGFMVMEPTVFEYLGDGSEMLEDSPFEKLAADNQMNAYKHDGFWSPMDTVHDKAYLEKLWGQGNAPWRV
ncbi:MAG: glucose-1-phosphate cytidylyltransferase [Roseburia sp.]|nr:glucose-1-phosphate cytidylyltransferase [Roseburia sp.]MCM1278091.1 glucose-1-phosphate cytidylyltransferase [Robinsoniella sp.]